MLILLEDSQGQTVCCDAARIVQMREDRDVPGCTRLFFEVCAPLVVRGSVEELQPKIHGAMQTHRQAKVSEYARSLGELWKELQQQSMGGYPGEGPVTPFPSVG